MAIEPFLAMTAAEIANSTELPSKIGWMACHFSPYGTGLSNLPKALPKGSMLILNDRTPIHGHDPKQIAQELALCMDTFDCSSLLLDFQYPGCAETAALICYLSDALDRSLVVSEPYARNFEYPVFLPPVPPSCPLEEHIRPWTGRDIWLEISTDGESIALTEQGANVTPLPRFLSPGEGFFDTKLHCHYKIEVDENILFTLWRTRENLNVLIREAEELGVKGTVGLYQEFSF